MSLLRPAAVLAVAFAATTADAVCTLAGSPLSVSVADLRPLIEAKINGTEVRFIVDSGAFYSVITPGTAAELGLHEGPGPFGLTVQGVGGAVTPSVTTVDEFTIAGVPLRHILFLVGGGETGGGTAGVLGQNVLHVADDDYDLANGVIRLVSPKGCGDKPLAYWAHGQPYSTMPLLGQDERFRMTKSFAFVNGRRISVTFDTGAGESFLTLEAAKRSGLDVNAPDARPAGMTGGIGRRRVRQWIVPVQSFKIGDEEIRNTHIRVGDYSLAGTDLLLGPDFFLSHHIYVANSQRKIYFTYNGGPVFDLGVQTSSSAAPAPGVQQNQTGSPGATEPTTAEGFSLRGEARASRREFAAAIADLTRARDLAPENGLYAYQRGRAYLENGQPLLAMAEFDAALKLDPDQIDALLARAQLRLAAHAVAQAKADLTKVDMLSSPQADERLALGQLYLRARDFAAAAPQFELWIKAHPDDSRLAAALNERCWSGGQSGDDLNAALAACDSALRRGPRNASFLANRGLVHLRRGETDKAIADYDASLAIDPKIAWSLYGRAVAEQRKGLEAQSKADFAAAAALAPKLADEAKARGITS